MKHKECGKPKEGVNVPRWRAEAGQVHYKCCGKSMRVFECNSIGMEQLGMYGVECEFCP